MRLLIVSSSYPLRPGSASGAFVAEMAGHLAAGGHAVRVLVPSDRFGATTPTPGPVEVRSVPYAWPPTARRLFHGAGLPDNLRRSPALALLAPSALATFGLAALAEARRCDLVVSHWLLPLGLVAGAAASLARVPHVAIAHSGDVTLAARLLPTAARSAFGAYVAATTRRVVFTHASLQQRYERAFGPAPDAVVCPMGVDPPSRAPAAKRSTARLRVLFVGRLEPVKGAATLLAALRACPEVEATLAGDGSERAFLEREAAALGGRARFVGHVPRAEVRRLYAEHDALVVPSIVTSLGRSEGVPHVALEAQAHGLPVVASSVGGLPEVVHADLDGLLVPPGNPAALAAALARLANDRALLAALAQGARENGERYAWPRVLARMGDGVW